MATTDELSAEIEQLRGMLVAIAKGDELKAKAAGIRIGSLRIYEELVAAGDARLYQQEKDGSKTDLTGAGTGGAPKDAKYLVGAAHADLSDEINVGLTPGGELGGTWPSPTVDATHSGSAHHAAVTLAADADVLLGLSTQQLTLDSQDANKVLAGPESGAAADPTFRVLVDADIPAAIARDAEIAAAAIAAVEAEATLDLTGAVTIAAGKSLAVDTIAEKTATAGLTIDVLSLIKDGVVYPDKTYLDAFFYSTVLATALGLDANDYFAFTKNTNLWSLVINNAIQLAVSETAIDAKTNPIQNVVDPTNAQDAATKAYADLKVAKSLFDAQTILAATTDDTPAALTIAEQRLVGRITGGNIAALTAAQILTLLSGQEADTFQLVFDAAPSADHTASGIVETLTAGTALVFGQAVYYGADGKMELTDADAEATSRCTHICLATIAENATGLFLRQGNIRDDTWNWTVGGFVYLDTATAGGFTQTAPSAVDDCIVIVGVAKTADILDFRPTLQAIVEHTA